MGKSESGEFSLSIRRNHLHPNPARRLMAERKPRLSHLAKNGGATRKLGNDRILTEPHLPHPLAKRRIPR